MAELVWDAGVLRRLRRRYETRRGDVSQAEIGQRVAELLGLAKPISEQVVSYWFSGREPKLLQGVALLRVLEVAPDELLDELRQAAASKTESATRREGRPRMEEARRNVALGAEEARKSLPPGARGQASRRKAR